MATGRWFDRSVTFTSDAYGDPMTTVLENGIQFESIFNFRDLGGHPTVSGERTRYGRVFRADGLHRCTPA
jgi:hypothetical protein